MEKQHRDLVMELITAHSQAQEAYERQVELEAKLAKAINIATLALDALHEVQTYDQPDDPYSENALTMHELDAFDFNVEMALTDLKNL